MSSRSLAQRQLRAVIYLRLSVTREESVSIEKTRAVCIAECEKEGFDWSEDRILVDDGLSGGQRRAKADRALEMLRTGEADVLVVWKWDRWSRQGIVAVGDLMDTLLKTAPRTRFIAIEDKLDSVQQFFPLMASFFAEQGRIERENTKLRVTGTIALLATKGRYYGGITPFGWTPAKYEDGPGYYLALHPEQYPVLREAIDRVLTGERVHAIVRDFNERKLISPEGKGWYDNALRRLLRNPIMRGYFMFHGHPVTGEDGLPIRPNHAALSDDDWYLLQATLDSYSWKAEGVTYGQHLLAGLAVCAYCGKRMNKRTHNLACSKHTREMVCPGPTIKREPVEQYVTAEFLDRYGEMFVMEETEVEQDTSRVREILEALDIVGKRLATSEDDEEDELLKIKRQLRSELRDLETSITGEVTVVRKETGKTYAEEWASASDELKREYLASHIREVVVRKGQKGGIGRDRGVDTSRVTIHWFEDDEIDAESEAVA